ncbi:NAD-dependent epimerase/dehydratase family protein [Achromobacter ruhlandii]|uniref:NAD-dependent epimerase/dehydratase family protein n=1 Tax=Achromobacter ruhlandii TaxID=72557 RepID=UPI001EEE64AC|nr:NAD-dependent epimerase/dehydratase family protein [Achromobacter ruhlandii]MCZ8396296.1 NAD-dependent epimerase/dehydratase family protein [Achromobacter ruhlandii]
MNAITHIKALKGPILVTGASGFIGANLFKLLLANRQDVFACVRREKGWRLADVDDANIVAVDLNDSAATKNLVDTLGPATVFDCASYGAYSFEEDPALIYQTNFQSLVNLVGLLNSTSISAYIHAGSSSEYGSNCTAPVESDRCEPNSHYAVSKVAAASYLEYMGKRGFPAVNLRLYAIYGPLEDSSRLIPNLVRKALDGKLPPFVDPTTSRDFLYVDDVCSAFIMAATKMQPDLYDQSFNIGSGTKTTIADLAEIARDTFGIEEAPQYGQMQGRAWDLADWYSNPARAREQLGWEPSYDLPTGLRLTAQWVSSLSDAQFSAVTKKNSANAKRSLSAIIACYKDAQAIPIMYQRLTATFQKIGIDYEIIFVNDGSPDNSAEVIREISTKDSRVIGISHSRNFGSQMAFRSGMELSTKQGVVLLDGDLQDPPELIEQFHAKWEEGNDVVYGRRVKRDMPWHWGLLYKLFYRVFAAFSYVKIPLDAGDFSLIDSRVVGWMLKCGERDLFMRGLRAYVGFKQTGVDYVRPERMFGVSTNSFVKNLDWAKKGIFSFSNTPLTMLTAAGIVLLGASALLALVAIFLRVFFPELAPRGATTLLLATLGFGSLNLFAIGLVGEYVAKIMAEVKGRPRLIRSALIRNGQTTELLPDGKDLPA